MKILVLLLLFLMPLTAQAYSYGQVQTANYDQPLRKLIDYASVDGQHLLRVAKATWVYNMAGCSAGATTTTCTSPVQLPANAVITRSFFYVVTQPLGSGTTGTTFAVQCTTANNIFSAADVSAKAATTYTEGVSTGAASAFSDVGTSTCNIKFLIANATNGVGYSTQGKINVYVQYFVHE